MNFQIQVPTILEVGGGSCASVGWIARRLRAKRTMIVTDPFLLKQGTAGRLQLLLQESGVQAEIFAETVPDPTTVAVAEGLIFFREGNYDSIVSLGGGSPIDTAKAIGMLSTNGGELRSYKVPNLIPKPGPPHIAIPTTAGTGSEVTRFTVITDSATGEKMLLAGASLVPTAAIVDFELTMSMPKRLTADTGTDALTHAIEAYVSRRANAFSDALALSAMKVIWEWLPVAYREADNREAREAMMLAATMAGMAFSSSSVALVHGMSRPIGAHFHVPHGLSNAMLLPEITSFSCTGAPERYAACARQIGIASFSDSVDKALEAFITELFARNVELEVPSPKTFGIAKDQYDSAIPKMAEQALASGSPQNNPRIPNAEDICELYRRVYEDRFMEHEK